MHSIEHYLVVTVMLFHDILPVMPMHVYMTFSDIQTPFCACAVPCKLSRKLSGTATRLKLH